MRTKITKEVLNNRLSPWTLRVIEYDKNKIILNNEVSIISRAEVILFYQRIKSKLDIDKIYNQDKTIGTIYLTELKRKNAELGGKAVQKKYNAGLYQRKIGILGKPSLMKGVSTNKIPWNKGKTKNTDARLYKLSRDRFGNKNPSFGKPKTDEYKIAQSIKMKEKILSGVFTPNTKNSRTHWELSYNGYKFRSSWELVWFALNPSFEFEKLRIPYFFNGIRKIYIVDFIDYINKSIVEIKPKEHLTSAKFLAKQKSVIEWAKINDYNFVIITQDYFINNLEKIKQLHLSDNIMKRITSIRNEN